MLLNVRTGEGVHSVSFKDEDFIFKRLMVTVFFDQQSTGAAIVSPGLFLIVFVDWVCVYVMTDRKQISLWDNKRLSI